MNQEIKQKWLATLRSGKYAQGRGYLRTENDEFCCLGVLCDLHARETNSDGWEDQKYLGECDVPTDDVLIWAGLPTTNRCVKLHCYMTLTGLNDLAKKTFEEIADIIED